MRLLDVQVYHPKIFTLRIRMPLRIRTELTQSLRIRRVLLVLLCVYVKASADLRSLS